MNLRNTRIITINYTAVVVGLLAFAAIGILSVPMAGTISGGQAATVKNNPGVSRDVPETAGIPILSDIIAAASDPNTTSSNTGFEIFMRLSFAVLLSVLLAFRPMKRIPLFQRNFHVVQTQILLAVVAASLMMIVGNNAARAFAIFAAVSLVRFRTNIKNPKEVTVLLASLAIGLSAGVGYWQLGTILCFFVMVLLWFLEYNEDGNSFRSMELTVKTRDASKTRQLLHDAFAEHELDSELRRIEFPKKTKKVEKISYFLNLRLDLSTDYLTKQIMSLDPENIVEVYWDDNRKALQIYE